MGRAVTDRPTFSRPSSFLRDSELPSLVNAPVAPETKKGRRIALTVVLVLAFAAVAWVASPLWVGMMFGTVMAFTTQPTYRRIVLRIGEKHRHLAAGLVTLLSGVVSAVIGGLCLYAFARELMLTVGFLQRKMTTGSAAGMFGDMGGHLIDKLGLSRADVAARIHSELAHASDRAASAAGIILQTTTSAVLGLIIALLTMYYVLLEWPAMATRLENVLPLDPRHTRALMLEFRDVGRSAFVGTVATAIVQGILGGIGYWAAGVDQPLTWGLMTGLASFLPLVGTAIVWATIAAFQLLSGHPVAGVFLLAWGVIVVTSLADYVIRPRLVGKKGHGHPLLMLIALLGGIEVMGLAGLIVAPILMSLFLATLRIYERETALLPGAAAPESERAPRF